MWVGCARHRPLILIQGRCKACSRHPGLGRREIRPGPAQALGDKALGVEGPIFSERSVVEFDVWISCTAFKDSTHSRFLSKLTRGSALVSAGKREEAARDR